MKTVYRYEIPPCDTIELNMPRGAQPLDFKFRQGRFDLWMLVDPNSPVEPQGFRMAGTGHPVKDEHCGEYIGTAITADELLAFHLFRITERRGATPTETPSGSGS